ncbi:MAG TPA: hypothetical protein VLJ37_10690 [bacterium]|nr:hypothetical protein [bacterium]
MKRLRVVASLLALPLMLAVTGCQKAEEPAKPEVKAAPKAAERPAARPAERPASQIEKDTLEACLKRNPDNAAYCRCYASELGKRYAEKAKSGDVSVQERGQMAVQSALACKQTNKK